MTAFGDVLASADDLAAVYGPPVDAVTNKIIDRLDGHCCDFIARAPFLLVATADGGRQLRRLPEGRRSWLRTGPRRAAARDSRRPGNKLVYSLRNIVDTGRVGLLFVIPGLEETLRVNGRACVTRDPRLLERFAGEGKPPTLAVGVDVEEAFLHCAKAFKRSALWRPDEWMGADGLAAPAQIWRDHMALDLTTHDVQQFVDDDYANNLTWK